jgi:hypothetical protein
LSRCRSARNRSMMVHRWPRTLSRGDPSPVRPSASRRATHSESAAETGRCSADCGTQCVFEAMRPLPTYFSLARQIEQPHKLSLTSRKLFTVAAPTWRAADLVRRNVGVMRCHVDTFGPKGHRSVL